MIYTLPDFLSYFGGFLMEPCTFLQYLEKNTFDYMFTMPTTLYHNANILQKSYLQSIQ